MQALVTDLTDWRTIYTALQCFTITGILFSWVAYAGKIPQIGVIATTLGKAVLPICEILIVVLTITSMFGTLIHLQVGGKHEHWSTAASTMQVMWSGFVIGAFNASIHNFS